MKINVTLRLILIGFALGYGLGSISKFWSVIIIVGLGFAVIFTTKHGE